MLNFETKDRFEIGQRKKWRMPIITAKIVGSSREVRSKFPQIAHVLRAVTRAADHPEP
ncbi:MAG: hypothetical protein WKG01_23865 [Kofleriaceae bacterium]